MEMFRFLDLYYKSVCIGPVRIVTALAAQTSFDLLDYFL